MCLKCRQGQCLGVIRRFGLAVRRQVGSFQLARGYMYALCIPGAVKHGRLCEEVFFYSLYIFFSFLYSFIVGPTNRPKRKTLLHDQGTFIFFLLRTGLFRTLQVLLVECCFTSTETVGLLGTGAQAVHLDFHTAPELRKFCSDVFKRQSRSVPWRDPAVWPSGKALGW